MTEMRGFLMAAEGSPAIALWSGLIFVTSILHITRKSSVGKRSFANKEHSHSCSFKGRKKWGEGTGESQGSAASLPNLELLFSLQNINLYLVVLLRVETQMKRSNWSKCI